MSSEEVKRTAGKLFHEVAALVDTPHSKVTVVGVGQVGMACAYAIMCKSIASEIALVDVMPEKLQGEMMDLQHGTAFAKNCTIRASTDYEVSKGSRVCIITAGARQREGETRLDLVQRNVAIYKGIVPQLVKHSPNTILLVVSNPVDVLTYVTWRLSGLPQERVFGSGTNLDTARFKFLISDKFKIAPTSCHGWIIGEHGDSSGSVLGDEGGHYYRTNNPVTVPVWSSVNVAGVPLRAVNPKAGTANDDEEWAEVHQRVVKSAYEVIKLKGYTSWAIGLSVAEIVLNVLGDTRKVCALSTNVKGLHGISNDVFLSVPVVCGENGLTHIVEQNLTDEEKKQLNVSADTIYSVQQKLDL